MTFFKKKEEKHKFGESPNSLQTQKKYVCTTFFEWLHAFVLKNKLCAHIFLSLERVRRFSKLIVSSFLKKSFSFLNDIKQRFLCELGVSLEKTHSKPSHMFSFFCYLLFLDKRNEFGVSLEILQTDSKFGPNSYVFIFSVYFFFGKREWVWSEFGDSLWGFSKLTPNSNDFYFFLCVFPFIVILNIFWEERNEFGVSLEVLQTLSKLTPNSLQTHMVSFCCFFFIVNLLFSFFPLSLLDLF